MTTNLALLRKPFPENQISYLPKGGVKLAYVGHAALTDRLLDTDPAWAWEPLALTSQGLPALDDIGGLWIKLTVCGVTRLGYGHAGSKQGGDAIKEIIGDALRNAAMRFGAALDLWHKGDLHAEPEPIGMSPDILADWITYINDSDKTGTLKARLAEAIKAALEVNDSRAVDQMQAAADAKAATAKAKATAVAAQ